LPNDQTVAEYRVRESWRARACAAGLSVGAQVFLFGTGVAMPLALSSAWIAALPVLPFSAAATALCRRRAENGRALSKPACLLLALTLLLNAVFALSALVGFAEQTLLEQARVLVSIIVTVTAVFLCALSGVNGISRLCFALRWALPALIAVLILASVPMEVPVGLFPIFGPGGAALGWAALCMLGAASPVVMLLLPPPDPAQAGGAAKDCPAPKTGFFVRRVLLGAGAGVLFLLAACVCTTYESIGESAAWGMRMRIVASDQPHEGIPQTLLTVLQMTAVLLLAVNMIGAGEQALAAALRRTARMRTGLIGLTLLMFAALVLLAMYGFKLALFAAPLLLVPSLLVPVLHGKREDAGQ